MRKALRTAVSLAFLALSTVSTSYAFKFPWDALKPELNAVKIECAKNAQDFLKADVKIGENMRSLADVKAQVGNIQTQLGVQASAIAGVGNKVSSLSAGRDNVQTTTTTNDTGLMKYIVYILGGICVWLIRSNMGKDKQISDLIERNTAKELKIFEMNDNHTTVLLSMIDKELASDSLTQGQKEADKILAQTEKEVK